MKHPITIVGTIIFAGSWLYLLFGSGADEYRSIVNLHKLAIAQGGIVSGIGMIIAGLIVNGFAGLAPSHQEGASLAAAPADIATGERTMSPEELTKALAEARAKLNKG